MGEAQPSNISCSNCGESLDPSWAHLSPRPPCPVCEHRGVTIAVGIAEEINVTGSLSVRMRPRDTDRNWHRRWTELETEWSRIDQPIIETMSGAAINASNHRLQSFYIQAYHLKDSLKSITPGIESMISANPILALLADLANLDKHSQLNRPPRSGDVPTIVSVTGEEPGSGGGWRFSLEIRHKGQTLDGMDVARKVMNAWRAYLKASGLLLK